MKYSKHLDSNGHYDEDLETKDISNDISKQDDAVAAINAAVDTTNISPQQQSAKSTANVTKKRYFIH